MEQKFSVLIYINDKSSFEWLNRALDSVLANTVRPSEIIAVVCGVKSPQIQLILDKAKINTDLRVLSYPVDYGRAFALQTALSRSSYELVALQDVNSISFPHRFEKQLAYFKEYPDTAVLGTCFQEIDGESLAPVDVHIVPPTHTRIKKILKRHCPFQHGTVMLKKQAVLEAGNYQAFPFLLEDYYLWVRVIGKGYKTANLPDILVAMPKDPAMRWVCNAWLFFQANKGLYDTMRKCKLIGMFSYYSKIVACFIKYLLIPDWLRNIFHKETWIFN